MSTLAILACVVVVLGLVGGFVLVGRMFRQADAAARDARRARPHGVGRGAARRRPSRPPDLAADVPTGTLGDPMAGGQ